MLRDILAAIAGKDYENHRRICQAGVAPFSYPMARSPHPAPGRFRGARGGPRMIHPLFEKSMAPSPWSVDFFAYLSAAGVIMVTALSLAVVAHFYSNRIGRG
jgi:hypothetical protein